MPSPEKIIWNNIKKQDADDAVLNSTPVQNILNRAETFADNLLHSIKHPQQENDPKLNKKEPLISPPNKPTFPVPNLQESIGLKVKKHKKETTLYNVTNTEEKLPTETRDIINKVSVRVRDFDVLTRLKNNDKTYTLITGEHVGLGLEQKAGSTKNSITGRYNVGNNKSEITFKHKDPMHSYSISCFNQNGNNGITTKYSNKSGFNSAFSADTESAAIQLGYFNQIDKYKSVEVGAFTSMGKDYKHPFSGINLRMTF